MFFVHTTTFQTEAGSQLMHVILSLSHTHTHTHSLAHTHASTHAHTHTEKYVKIISNFARNMLYLASVN
jgi:hypothetical protein